jgi:hypothetical protein
MPSIPLKQILVSGYFGGCAVFTVTQAVYGWMLGHRWTEWVAGVALQALYSPWWPLFLSYALPYH